MDTRAGDYRRLPPGCVVKLVLDRVRQLSRFLWYMEHFRVSIFPFQHVGTVDTEIKARHGLQHLWTQKIYYTCGDSCKQMCYGTRTMQIGSLSANCLLTCVVTRITEAPIVPGKYVMIDGKNMKQASLHSV